MYKNDIWRTKLKTQELPCILSINELMYNSATSCHEWIAFELCHTVSLLEEIMPWSHFLFAVDHIDLLHNKYY